MSGEPVSRHVTACLAAACHILSPVFRERSWRWRRPCTAMLVCLTLAACFHTQFRAEDGITATIGLAYRYALPLYEISRLRYQLQFDPAHPRHLPPNYLFHRRNLASPQDRLITAPNADTLYSLAIVDLSGGPVRIDVPDTGGRYYSLALIDAYTNDFAYIGRRATGTRAGSYLLVGPEEKAGGRDGLPILRAPTPIVVLLVRILVDGPEDLDAVHRLQDGFKLTALGIPPRRSAPIAPVPDSGENFVAVVNQALAENPPPPVDAPVLDRIGTVGIGPHAAPFGAELRRAWNDHFAEAQRSLAAATKSRRELINGWLYPPADEGNFGTDYDTRAAVALAGLFAHRREENVAVGAVADNTGLPLDSSHRYRLRLPARMPVDAFWSLSIYAVQPDGRQYFAENPLHRYAIGDRTPGLRRNADGSLDILIQRNPPEAGWEANWLPMPDGPFRLALRNYQPRPELLDGRFRYPSIERLD
jgi:hypothetical protein